MRTATDIDAEQRAVEELRSTRTARERATWLLERARQGDSHWFTVHDDDVAQAAEEVAAITRIRYPDLAIPYHSRWRHFEAGGIDRRAPLEAALIDRDPAGRAHTMMDLTVVSVLLDAGAGADWRFHERASGRDFTRSEGLGVASWHAFADGVFSSDPADPLRVDAAGLRSLTVERLGAALQVAPDNPLIGLDGRVAVLHRLGAALAARPEVFGPLGRPGRLFDVAGPSAVVDADAVLTQVLSLLSGIWLADNTIGHFALGDCWRHEALPGEGLTRGWMPLHKLSQWLTYSLLEPFEWAGVRVERLDALTGLPEYRNGGLLLDTGALRLRDPSWSDRTWSVADELVVEWRALTVALLDELAPLVRRRLAVDERRLPLACVLEGGTWAAGRALAQRLRGGLPPLRIISDGTVF